MNIDPNSSALTARAAVTGAIRNAAQLTGADFRYLLATAQVESNLNPQSAAPTSTAKGLFQFISQTWLATLKEQGPALGYGRFADAIAKQPSGQYVVTDPALSQQIMNLRSDPTVSAMMAGAFTKANAGKLSAWLGRAPSEGELYVAHFLGPNGAAKLIDLAEARPQTPAAQIFPGAANANPSIFFDRAGQARSVADVYRVLVGRYDMARTLTPQQPPVAATPAVAAPALAATAARPALVPAAVAMPITMARRPPGLTPTLPAAAAVALPVAMARRNTMLPQVLPVAAAVAPAMQTPASPQAVAAKPVVQPAVETGPVFHSLFRTTERAEPLSPLVNALWSTPPLPPGLQPPQPAAPRPVAAPQQPAATPAQQPAPSAARPGSPLDLFQDQAPNVRALFGGRAS